MDNNGGFRVCGSALDWYELQHHRASAAIQKLQRLHDISQRQCGSLGEVPSRCKRTVGVEVRLSNDARSLINKEKQQG